MSEKITITFREISINDEITSRNILVDDFNADVEFSQDAFSAVRHLLLEVQEIVRRNGKLRVENREIKLGGKDD